MSDVKYGSFNIKNNTLVWPEDSPIRAETCSHY
jgi:hypothetical protein